MISTSKFPTTCKCWDLLWIMRQLRLMVQQDFRERGFIEFNEFDIQNRFVKNVLKLLIPIYYFATNTWIFGVLQTFKDLMN